MKKIFLLISLCLLFVSCGKQENEELALIESTEIAPAAIDPINPVNPSSDIPDFGDIISMIGNDHKENSIFRSCMQNTIDTCIQEVSFVSGAQPVCDDFILASNKENCEHTQIISQAKAEKDISLCDELGYSKDSCMYEVVMSIGMEELDVSICEDLGENYQIGCHNEIIKKKAQTEKNVEICDNIRGYNPGDEENNFEKQFCIDQTNFSIEEDKMLKEQETLNQPIINEIQETTDNIEVE